MSFVSFAMPVASGTKMRHGGVSRKTVCEVLLDLRPIGFAPNEPAGFSGSLAIVNLFFQCVFGICLLKERPASQLRFDTQPGSSAKDESNLRHSCMETAASTLPWRNP